MASALERNVNEPQVSTYEILKSDVAKDCFKNHVVCVSKLQFSLLYSQINEEIGVIYHNIEPKSAIYSYAPHNVLNLNILINLSQ
jgi:hypothetical protein